MSVSTEVQRTLVKSPPELWAELSSPEALARHLDGLGAIRITAVEPETKVEWEAQGVSGVVQLKQSGWGTKVTLSVTRTAPASEKPPSEPEAIAEPADAEAETERVALAEPEIEPVILDAEPVAVETQPEPEAIAVETGPVAVETEPIAVETEPIAVETQPERELVAVATVAPEPEPQLGFFARLFRKRKAKRAAVVEPEPEPACPRTGEVAAPATPEPDIELVALAAPEPVYPEPPAEPQNTEQAEGFATELESLEAQMTAETTELLTGVLDRLGAAHHRPFSRG